MFNFGFKRKRSGFPRGFIFYSRTPNSEAIAWGDETTWEEAQLWSGWELSVDCYAAVGGSAFWFADELTPVAHTGAEILASENINRDNVIFSTGRGLIVYPADTSLSVLSKVYRYSKLPFVVEATDELSNQLTDGSGNIIITTGY